LIEALDDECEEVRRAVAWALQNCVEERGLPTFIRMLRDNIDSVKLWAAFGLQRVGDETAVEALIESLEDPYDSVREQAVITLAKIRDHRAVNPLRARDWVKSGSCFTLFLFTGSRTMLLWPSSRRRRSSAWGFTGVIIALPSGHFSM